MTPDSPARFLLPTLLVASWVVLAIVIFAVPAHWPVLGIWLALLLGTVGSGSVMPSWDFFGRSWSKNPARSDAIALTFDDGPDPVATRAVARALEGRGWRGTFFVVGRRVLDHPDVVRELSDAGHQIGLHGHEHRWHLMLREPRLVQDLLACDAAVHAAVGRHPRWYRSPIALVSPPLMNVLRQWRLFYAGFSVRPFDGGGALTSESLRARVAELARAGDVVLLHDATPMGRPPGRPPVVDALPGILDDLAARGLKGVTMSELFDKPAWFGADEVSEAARRAFRRGRLQLSVWATTCALLIALAVFGGLRSASAAPPGKGLPPELLDAAAALAVNDTVAATFEQRKTSALFAQDMVRTGTLRIRRSDGRLLWSYDDGAAFLMADGRFFPVDAPADAQGGAARDGFVMPGGAEFTAVLEALLTLSPEGIARFFTATVLEPGRFALVPRDLAARGLFRRVVLEISGVPLALRSTSLEEPSGDRTVLTFTDIAVGTEIPPELFRKPSERPVK